MAFSLSFVCFISEIVLLSVAQAGLNHDHSDAASGMLGLQVCTTMSVLTILWNPEIIN
jgi:hypothetical protein